ncbi:MAG: hypothetical protein MIN69_12145 [Methylorubrum extorquens]|jgi:hypothetical protein|uniref:hypothetical protein n=1 Tax=Methylorubrum extorquens TaxID=408 RepID=UPI002FEE2441
MTVDIKLRALLEISKDNDDVNIHEWAIEVTTAFRYAEKNIRTLSYMIPAAINATIVQEKIIKQAIFSVTGGIEEPDSENSSRNIMNAIESGSGGGLGYNLEETLTGDLENSLMRFEIMATVPELFAGLQVYMSAILTTAWTSFEILTGDLWESALNHHPHILSELRGNKNRIFSQTRPKGNAAADSSGGATDKSVPLQLLQQYSYNLEASMGSILRQSQSFDRLEGIRAAYSMAFSDDSNEIDGILARKNIDAINGVRNLLVHQGGRIDSRYLKSVSRIEGTPSGQIGAQLLLDGQTVADMVNDLITAGYDLIQAVDQWVQRHPDKRRTDS